MSEHSHHALLLQSQAPSSSSSSSSLPDTNRSDSSSSYHIIDSESELKICNASRAPGGIGDENQIGQNKTDDNANNTTTTTLSRLSLSPSPQQPPMITMQPIGYISSIYRLCVGTPRQGLLAPNSRGRINLFPNRIAFDSIQDLEHFSHVWIVFVFHLNSNGNVHLQSQASESMSMKMMNQQQQQQQQQFPSKIKPPALGGKRVGIFATRSPHRPNPIGFSLCRIDQVVIPASKKKKNMKVKKGNEKQQKGGGNDASYFIDISGLDLVDGTPVLDIKPYVPHYDSVGYSGSMDADKDDDDNGVDPCLDHPCPVSTAAAAVTATAATTTTTATTTATTIASTAATTTRQEQVMLPQWVSDGLDKRRLVEFTSNAIHQLKEIFLGENGPQGLEFYGKHTGRDETDVEAMENFMNCIQQVLSVDVRSKWQTTKARKGKSRAEMAQRVKEMSNSRVGKEGEGGIRGQDDDDDDDDDSGDGFCTQQLDHLLIKFHVREGCAKEDEKLAVDTQGSGADDVIVVMGVEYLAV